MTEVLQQSALRRWRQRPVSFVEQVLCDPETGRPFVLLPAERDFLSYAFKLDVNGRLLFTELLYSAPKKSGKTTLAAIVVLVVVLLYGGRYGEAISAANDYEQAVSRVVQQIKRIIECSPLLKHEAKITQDRITIGRAVILGIPSDYASAAGSNHNIAVFDELWAFQSERARRLFDELVPPPTKQIACRLTVTYAGWRGESVLLEELYQRGLAQPVVAPNLHAGDGILMFWAHEPVAPWQDARWLDEMRRSLRVNQYLRMIENRFVDNTGTFIELAAWDACINPVIGHTLTNPVLPIWVGCDASVKHDQTAIVAVTFDARAQQVRLVTHRIFQPSPTQPLDFEATIETFIRDLAKRFRLRRCLYDPYQMQASAQRLVRDGIAMQEFPQSLPNLTSASQNLYDLILSRSLCAYPDAAFRLAVSRCVAVESPRGWRIAKERQVHKIDVIIALAMASYAAIQSQTDDDQFSYSMDAFDPNFRDLDEPGRDQRPPDDASRQAQRADAAALWTAIFNGSLDR
jgi:phage terminase large subunit-like protein